MNAGAAPRLWLVRHARPDVAAGLCYGRLDVPARPGASRAAARKLARALPRQVAAVRHSPLQRCELLAHDLRGLRPDLAEITTPEPRIAELDFGHWEGRPWDTLARAELDAWSARLHHHAPGGGEALAAMLARVAGAFDDAARMAWACGPGADVVWLTHAGVARCVDWLLQHGPLEPADAARWPLQAPAFGGWATVPLPRRP